MKTNKLITTVILGIVVFSCSQVREKSAKELLKGEKMRDEIYDVIFSDREYTKSVLDKMIQDSIGRLTMAKNSNLIKMMCSPDRIDSMMNVDNEMMENMANILVNKMEADTAACSLMCGKVMASDHLKIYVMEHVCNTKIKK